MLYNATTLYTVVGVTTNNKINEGCLLLDLVDI